MALFTHEDIKDVAKDIIALCEETEQMEEVVERYGVPLDLGTSLSLHQAKVSMELVVQGTDPVRALTELYMAGLLMGLGLAEKREE